MLKTLISAATLLIATIVTAQAVSAVSEEAKTEAAVIAADDDWLVAEQRGDVRSLDARLADGYREIDPDGTVYPKADLIRMAANHKPPAKGTSAQIASEFRKQHPMIENVEIFGDTAILSFHSTDPAIQSRVLSLDVFTYQYGKWRGVLSKQSTPPKTAI